jgi:hypothetical protein
MHGCSSSTPEARGRQGAQLHRRLADTGPVARAGDSASRCRPRPHPEPGAETQHKEECVDALPEDYVPGSCMGLHDDAGTNVSRTHGVHTGDGLQSEARPQPHCEAVPETAGAHGSSVQCYTFWPATHETRTVVVENQGIFPEGKSVPYDQGNAQMPSFPRHMEETLVPVPGTGAGSIMLPESRFNRCLPHWLGRGHGRPLCERSVGDPAFFLAHQLPGNAGGLQSSEEFFPGPLRSPCPDTLGQHVRSRVSESPGRSEVAPSMQTGTPDPSVVPGETVVSQSDVYPRGPKSGSRRPVEAGAEARGVATPPRGGGGHVREIRPSGSGSVRVSRDVPLSTVVLSQVSSSVGAGRYDTDVAEAASVRISPDRSAPGSLGAGPPGRDQPTFSSTPLADPDMVLGHCSTARRPPMAGPSEEGSAVSGRGHNISPPARAVEPLGLAPEGARYLEAGLSAGVVETLLSSRAPSTRRLYSLKWNVFSTWCREREVDPVNCPVASVLEFLQDRFSAGLSPSTLKVYVAAIAVFHSPIGAGPLGRHHMVVRFLRGARRIRPAARSRVPTWDLAVVLEGLAEAPFEPLESAEAKNLTFKVAFLLAITSLRRVGDLQALAISPTCLEFAPGGVRAILHPRPGYVPKVPSSAARSVVLQAFHPPPHGTAEEGRLHLLCPVRALRVYLEKSSQWRKSDQLLVCFGSPKKGLPASKQTISNWIVQAIATAYQVRNLPSPMAVRAHSTRSMASSVALLSGVSLQEICEAAGWATPHTFIRFYSLQLPVTPGARVLAS